MKALRSSRSGVVGPGTGSAGRCSDGAAPSGRTGRRSGWLAVGLAATVLLAGCDFQQRFVNKPWGKGAYIPAAVCAVVGAGVGVVIQNERPGTSTASVRNPDGTIRTISTTDDKELWKGAVIGAPIGAVVCGALGHYFLDPEVATPTPPPLPPPPVPSPTVTPAPLPPPSSQRIVLRGVHFDFDKSDIRPDSRPVLDEAASVLRDNPNVHISVEGHTDSVGSDAYNQKLSLRRAQAVYRYLVNHGVSPEQMDVAGYGKSRPVADNATESGRAQNRRVELHVTSQAHASAQ